MGLSLAIVHSVDQCDPQEWDKLGGGVPFSSHRWSRFGEAVLHKDKPIYLIVSDGEQQVARATFWLKTEEILPIPSMLVSKGINRMFQRWPLLICSSPLSNSNGLILPDSEDSPEIYDLLMANVTRFIHQEAVSFMTLDYLGQHQARQLSSRGELFPIALPEPGTRMAIRWSSFESYLKHLSKNERKSYKRAVRKSKELGIEVRRYSKVTDTENAIRLIREHDRRYKTPTVSWAKRMLEKAPMVDAVWLAAYVKDELVACELLLGDNGTWVATSLGRDYNYPYAYFVLGYEAIKFVIQDGGKQLRWGAGTYEYKLRLGFELEDSNFVCFMARNRWVDQVFRKLASKLV